MIDRVAVRRAAGGDREAAAVVERGVDCRTTFEDTKDAISVNGVAAGDAAGGDIELAA